MSGQQYDAQVRPRHLHFAPHHDLIGDALSGSSQSVEWPVFLPHVSALARLSITENQKICTEIRVLSGSMDLNAASMRLTLALPSGEVLTMSPTTSKSHKLQQADQAVLCSSSTLAS